MPSLKEIKGRIGSVKSTLKITSAMKLVASAKLRKAQQAIEGMRPYERKLQEMLSRLMAGREGALPGAFARNGSRSDAEGSVPSLPAEKERVAIVAFASNSSLCGAFNANAVRLTMEALKEYADADVTVYSVGRKMADSMRKVGKPTPEDYQKLADKPAYAPAAELAEKLMEDFREGRLDRVELIYNHFVSSGKQVPVRETFLPMSPVIPGEVQKESDIEYILEPSASELLEELLPKSLKLKFFTALLDSNASEHAARTVAMQLASDNADELLEQLTLEYNKRRQQAITSELLDIVGGSMS